MLDGERCLFHACHCFFVCFVFLMNCSCILSLVKLLGTVCLLEDFYFQGRRFCKNGNSCIFNALLQSDNFMRACFWSKAGSGQVARCACALTLSHEI